jgi:hypothetical protein
MTWLRRGMLIRILLVLAVLLAVGWLALSRLAGSSDPVTDREALAAFRAASSGAVHGGGPSPGVYRYRATGTEHGGVGPLAISRDVPAEAFLVVTPSPGGWESELSYSRQHIEGVRYVVRDGALLVTSRRTKITFAGFGQDDRRAAEPPSVLLPAGAAPGTKWTENYRTGDISIHNDDRIVRAEAVQVAGKPIKTLVIEYRSTTTGAHPGTRTETTWWAPTLGLPVRSEVEIDIGGVFAFRAKTRLDLVSTVPRR